MQGKEKALQSQNKTRPSKEQAKDKKLVLNIYFSMLILNDSGVHADHERPNILTQRTDLQIHTNF